MASSMGPVPQPQRYRRSGRRTTHDWGGKGRGSQDGSDEGKASELHCDESRCCGKVWSGESRVGEVVVDLVWRKEGSREMDVEMASSLYLARQQRMQDLDRQRAMRQ